MAKTLKTTGIYANLIACIGVEDDNTTVKDFKVPSRTVTLSAGVTVADGAYGRGVRVISSAGDYAPRGIALSPAIAQANGSGARTTIIIFNDYTHTKDARRYYNTDTTAGNGWRINGGGGDGENPRVVFAGTITHTSPTKNIKSGRSFVALGVDYGATKVQRLWVAVDGETFPGAPEHDGSSTLTSAGTDSIDLIGGSGGGSMSADIFAFLEFDILLTHSQVETIYNSLTGSGACDCFVPPAAPTISADPTDQTVTAPAPATFAVTATGSGNSYQVQRSTDGGATPTNVGAPSGSNSYTTGATAVSGGSHNNGDLYRFAVSNAGGGPVYSDWALLTVNAPVDSTAPTWPGGTTLEPSALTTTGVTVTASAAATDGVGVTGYETSFDAGATYTPNDPVTSRARAYTGGTPGATINFRMRAFDAAGNRSAPLSLAQTLANTNVSLGPLGSSGTYWPNGTAVLLNWFPGWRAGEAIPGGAVARSATVTGSGGMLPVAGLPAGAGGGLVTKRGATAADDEVAIVYGTVV